MLVGHKPRRARLRSRLAQLGFRCLVESDPSRILSKLTDETDAILIVPPLTDESAVRLCRRLREAGQSQPIFVVIKARLDPSTEAQLRKAGATGSFSWPAEDRALVAALVRITQDDPERAASDIALEERVRVSIDRYLPKPGDTDVDVHVTDRVVRLTGTVAARWVAEKAKRLASAFSSAQWVDTRGLELAAERRSTKPKHWAFEGLW